MKPDFNLLISDPKSIIQGNKYRITVLSDVLLRLEYNENGIFNDYPTLNVINRKFPLVDFKRVEEKNKLIIETYFFKLEYEKESDFSGSKLVPDANLRVYIKQTKATWYLNNPEVRNMKAAPISREGDITKTRLGKGLYSTDGFSIIDDSNTLIFNLEGSVSRKNQKGYDIYLFAYGTDFKRALKSYFNLTGASFLLPRYALGLWWNKYDNYNVDKIKDIHTKFKINNIPYSVFVLNNWQTNKNSGGYTFNKTLIPNEKILAEMLKEDNIKIALDINPFGGIQQNEERIAEFKRSLNTTTASIIPFNVYDIKFMISFLNTFIKPLNDIGFNTFIIKSKTNDSTIEFIFNHYLHNYLKTTNKRGLILSKNTDYCSHRNSIAYSEETSTSYKTLDFLPYLNLTSTNKAVNWWSHSIGGFNGGIEDPNLFIRYIQFGTFSPIFRISSDYGKFYKREPWKWDSMTYEISKKYIRLRYKLIPYLYNLNFFIHKYSSSLITPLYHVNPDIINEPQFKNEYFLGSELLIAPITTKEDSVLKRTDHKFYLPKGNWFEFKTGNKYAGDKRYTKLYKSEDYPVFVKEGTILPLAILDNNDLNNTSPTNNLEIHIFPGKNNVFNFYEDDGETFNYLKGDYILTNFEYLVKDNGYILTIKPLQGKRGIIPDFRNYKIVFRNISDTNNIEVVNNNQIKEYKKRIENNNLVLELQNISTYENLKITINDSKEVTNVYRKQNDIEEIISDFVIPTKIKENISEIINSNNSYNTKKSLIKKLKKQDLNEVYIETIIKLISK